jgi:hypothetical protein
LSFLDKVKKEPIDSIPKVEGYKNREVFKSIFFKGIQDNLEILHSSLVISALIFGRLTN